MAIDNPTKLVGIETILPPPEEPMRMYVWDASGFLAMAYAPDVDTAREMLSRGWHVRAAAFSEAILEDILTTATLMPIDSALAADPFVVDSPVAYVARRAKPDA